MIQRTWHKKSDGSGAASARSAAHKENSNGHCNICGSDLQVLFMRPRHNAHVCNNFLCSLFASPQYYTEIPDDLNDLTRPVKSHTEKKPSVYVHYARKRENYRLLRSLGVGSKQAGRMTSDKQTTAYIQQYRLSTANESILERG